MKFQKAKLLRLFNLSENNLQKVKNICTREETKLKQYEKIALLECKKNEKVSGNYLFYQTRKQFKETLDNRKSPFFVRIFLSNYPQYIEKFILKDIGE